MRHLFSRALALAAFAGLAVAAAPASAVYTDGVRAVTLAQNANPNGVSRPAIITAGRDAATANSEPDTYQIYVEVTDFVLNPGTSKGEQIGVVDLTTSSAPIQNQRLETNGNGTWLVTVPGGIQIPITIELGKGLVNGQPGDKPGSTLVSLKVPSTAETFGLKLTGFSLKFNVDAKGCPTAAPGLTNAPKEGTYTVTSLFIPRDLAGNPDPANQNTRTTDVAVKAGQVSALPEGCPGATAEAAKVSATPKLIKNVKAGQKLTFKIKNTGGQASYQVKKAGKVLKNINLAGAGKVTNLVVVATKAEQGKTIVLQLTPATGSTGNAASVRYQVKKAVKKPARHLRRAV